MGGIYASSDHHCVSLFAMVGRKPLLLWERGLGRIEKEIEISDSVCVFLHHQGS